MSGDNVTPIRPGLSTAVQAGDRTARRELAAAAEQHIEEVWQLRTQVLEHIKAIEGLCDRMLDLPHVWGVCPAEVADHLDGIEAMLTPCGKPEPSDPDYPAWRRLMAFKEARNIET